MASQQRPDASPTQGERRITFEDDAVKEKPQQRTSPVPAIFSGASKSSSGSGSGSSGSSWENISMRVFGGRGYLTGSGEDLLEPGPEFIDEKENEEADKEAADEHDAYMHAARAFMVIICVYRAMLQRCMGIGTRRLYSQETQIHTYDPHTLHNTIYTEHRSSSQVKQEDHGPTPLR